MKNFPKISHALRMRLRLFFPLGPLLPICIGFAGNHVIHAGGIYWYEGVLK